MPLLQNRLAQAVLLCGRATLNGPKSRMWLTSRILPTIGIAHFNMLHSLEVGVCLVSFVAFYLIAKKVKIAENHLLGLFSGEQVVKVLSEFCPTNCSKHKGKIDTNCSRWCGNDISMTRTGRHSGSPVWCREDSSPGCTSWVQEQLFQMEEWDRMIKCHMGSWIRDTVSISGDIFMGSVNWLGT